MNQCKPSMHQVCLLLICSMLMFCALEKFAQFKSKVCTFDVVNCHYSVSINRSDGVKLAVTSTNPSLSNNGETTETKNSATETSDYFEFTTTISNSTASDSSSQLNITFSTTNFDNSQTVGQLRICTCAGHESVLDGL